MIAFWPSFFAVSTNCSSLLVSFCASWVTISTPMSAAAFCTPTSSVERNSSRLLRISVTVPRSPEPSADASPPLSSVAAASPLSPPEEDASSLPPPPHAVSVPSTITPANNPASIFLLINLLLKNYYSLLHSLITIIIQQFPPPGLLQHQTESPGYWIISI